MYVVTLGLLNDDDDDIVIHLVSKSYFGEIGILSILAILQELWLNENLWVGSTQVFVGLYVDARN